MPTTVLNRPLVKRGAKGQNVARIQAALQKAGFSPGKVDSDFGLKTEMAVKNFQKANHLLVDGVVGPKTWALLQKFSTPNTIIVNPKNTFKPKGISKEDFQMLVRITQAEAEDQGYIGKAAVAASILNRVNHPEYKSPKNIYVVLHQSGQYSPMSDGRYWKVNPNNEETKKAVQAAVDGYDPSNGATVFWNPDKVGYNAWRSKRKKTIKIKDHQFAK